MVKFHVCCNLCWEKRKCETGKKDNEFNCELLKCEGVEFPFYESIEYIYMYIHLSILKNARIFVTWIEKDE